MRTTLTIDDDLADLLEERARELGVPIEEAVKRTIRAGLAAAAVPHEPPKVIPHSFGVRPGIDLAQAVRRHREERPPGRRARGDVAMQESRTNAFQPVGRPDRRPRRLWIATSPFGLLAMTVGMAQGLGVTEAEDYAAKLG